MNYDAIVVGAGFCGSVIARGLADKGKKVLLLEKRNHIAGNMYETIRSNGIRIHKYGPHIFHTNLKEVFDYLKKYSGFYFYEHRVLGKIDEKLVPIPFNFKSIELLFESEKAELIKSELKKEFPAEEKVSILDLIHHKNKIVKELGEYVYEKVFANYTAKQWEIPIEEIDTSVINRVPVLLGYDDRYFQDEYQFMPKEGFTKLFENILNHENITLELNQEASLVLNIDTENKKILYNGEEFNGNVIFTGAIDQILNYQYGPLPYRSLKLQFEDYEANYYQPVSVVNYPNEEDYTRITEFKYLSNQNKEGFTTILKEYPRAYDYKNEEHTPYYVISSDENQALYNQYYNAVKDINNFYLCGRLAEYKYYNMDAAIKRAMEILETIK